MSLIIVIYVLVTLGLPIRCFGFSPAIISWLYSCPSACHRGMWWDQSYSSTQS